MPSEEFKRIKDSIVVSPLRLLRDIRDYLNVSLTGDDLQYLDLERIQIEIINRKLDKLLSKSHYGGE